MTPLLQWVGSDQLLCDWRLTLGKDFIEAERRHQSSALRLRLSLLPYSRAVPSF
jgi:hypothetical protein